MKPDTEKQRFEWTSAGPEETQGLAKRIANQTAPGDLILLRGELGAGKTTFVQGLAASLAITSPVTSPTFTLVNEYTGGRLPLYHLDLYRLSGPNDAIDVGFFDYLEQGGVVVVEWPERLDGELPEHRLEIRIDALNENQRKITLIPYGEHYKSLVVSLGT